ncbi:MAG: hypothetical protein SYNGOMJ08_00846 [Candidatus Syntrophoarchaeum sp. GoM_oil]|nr:MAG: hypothetical protein SYNGOMJ08_00846 [Candidatus Syntrophoarchaeum sp. GoM_oil]
MNAPSTVRIKKSPLSTSQQDAARMLIIPAHSTGSPIAGCSSIMTVFAPCAAAYFPAIAPQGPPPMTATSNLIRGLSVLLV